MHISIHLAGKYIIITDYGLIEVLFMPEDYVVIIHDIIMERGGGSGKRYKKQLLYKLEKRCNLILWLFAPYEISKCQKKRKTQTQPNSDQACLLHWLFNSMEGILPNTEHLAVNHQFDIHLKLGISNTNLGDSCRFFSSTPTRVDRIQVNLPQ